MVAIKFKSIPYENKKIVFCIVDTTDDYPSSWVKELVKNNIDFEISTITGQGFDVVVGFNEDDLLKNVSLDYEYAVMANSGTVWADNLNFFSLINAEINEDFFITGHVLDKKEAYYELHPQCYLINLKQYRDLGCPEIGNQSLYDSHLQLKPNRSKENYHDDYTPLWVSKGQMLEEYKHKCHGWNILSLGFKQGYIIKPFDEKFRNCKRYLYPDNNTEITERLSEFYLENNVASRSWFNPFSTANSLSLGPTLPGTLKNLVTPTNGIDWVHMLVHHGFDENTRVRFTDYNLMSLQFAQEVVQWDGKDYPALVHNFSAKSAAFLNLPENIWVGIKDNINEKWNDITKQYDWPVLWKEIQNKVKFEFRFKDFLHYEGPYGRDSDYWLDNSFNDPCTLISLNHVFNYHSTGVFYSLKYRVDMENYTLNRLKKLVPEAHIYFDHRSWKGFRPYNDKSLSGQVKDIETVSTTKLIRPTWHYNNDWNE